MSFVTELLEPSKVYAPGICAEVLRDPSGYVRFGRLIRVAGLKGKALKRFLERYAREHDVTPGQAEFGFCLMAVAKAEGRKDDLAQAMLSYQRAG